MKNSGRKDSFFSKGGLVLLYLKLLSQPLSLWSLIFEFPFQDYKRGVFCLFLSFFFLVRAEGGGL